MKASIVDLRYKTRDILDALDRNETVTVLYHGKVKGILTPVRQPSCHKVTEHAFFGMHKDNELSVLDELDALRQPRHAV